MESKTNVVYGFFRHCMQDGEANSGGIPSRETHWMKRLGWTLDSPELEAFYQAWDIIYGLNKGGRFEVIKDGNTTVIHFND